jgi:energy-coupling factor transport system permease protein
MLDAATLLRFVPPAFYHAGLVLTIGLAFIPQTVLGFQEIWEAQRIRGHQPRAARDLLPLIGPLLTTGLERAVQLAESLEARGLGYVAHEQPDGRGGVTPPLPPWLAQLGLLLGGLGLGSALFSLGYWGRGPWILALGLAGAAVLVGTLRRLTPSGQRTRYRRLGWARQDLALVGISLVGIALLGLVVALRPLALFYTPYLRLSWPLFEAWLGIAYLLLLAPLTPFSQRERQG